MKDVVTWLDFRSNLLEFASTVDTHSRQTHSAVDASFVHEVPNVRQNTATKSFSTCRLPSNMSVYLAIKHAFPARHEGSLRGTFVRPYSPSLLQVTAATAGWLLQ